MNRPFSFNNVNPVTYFLGIGVLIGFVFTFIASTGTSDSPDEPAFVIRLLQWQVQSLIPIVLMIFAHILLSKSASFSALNPWLGIVLSGILGTTIFAPIALGLDLLLTGEEQTRHLWLELFDEWLSILPPAVLFWGLINAPWILGMDFSQPQSTDNSTTENNEGINKASSESKNEQLSKFELGLHRHIKTIAPQEILRMSAELHYVDVVTQSQHKLVLYALKEAIAEMPPEQGMQVHRSHWIAFSAIAGFEKVGKQGRLTLINGDLVPVSRSFINALGQRLAL